MSTPHSPETVSPSALVDYLRSAPFQGAVTLSHDELQAGTLNELTLVYTVGAAGLADSGVFKATFRFYSDWALFQTDNPAGADYLSVEYLPRASFPGESPATVRKLGLRFDPKGHERPFQKAIIVDVIDGYLSAGDRIVLRLGDRRFGGPGTRVQSFAEDRFQIRCYVDTAGTSRFATLPEDLLVRIVPGATTTHRVIGPRLLAPGASGTARFRAEDAWGNVTALPRTSYLWTLREQHSGRAVAAGRTRPTEGLAAVLDLPVTLPEGHFTLLLSETPTSAVLASTPLSVSAAAPSPRSLFADLHIHSLDTVGTNSPVWNLRHARDEAGLDVFGYTVNDFQISVPDWNHALATLRDFHRDGSFVAFAGTEWCGASNSGGDHNVVFLRDEIRFPSSPQGRSLRSFEWHEGLGGVRQPKPGLWPIDDLYETYGDQPEAFLLIPHVGGRRALADWHQPQLERLVEVCSSWGHFDWFYRDFLAHGHKVGASGAGDEHRGRPGGGAPGVSVFGVRGGLTGVIAPELTRKAVGEALRARHTWATTGERSVAHLWSGDALQGDELSTSGPLEVHYRLLGQKGWEYLSLNDHRGPVWKLNLHEKLGYSAQHLRLRWGGARIRDRYRWAEWKGGLKLENLNLLSWSSHGLEHPAETVSQNGNTLTFHTETYGDSDGITLRVENLNPAGKLVLKGNIGGFRKTANAKDENPFSSFSFEFTVADLLARGSLRQDLGGEGLFVALERVTDKALPLALEDTLSVAPVPTDLPHRPLYLHARELDDAKVWTSPLFWKQA